MAGLSLLVWIPTLPSLTPLNRVAGMLAGASLCICLTHWQVYPHLDDHSALLALVASLVVGIAYSAITTRAIRRLTSARQPHTAKTHAQ
jgi:hypothetical protein